MLNNETGQNLLTRVCLMEASGVRAVKAAYVQLNEYLNRPPLQAHQIQAYARDLEDYPSHLIVRALEEMRRTPGRRYLPLPWEVVEFMAPKSNDDDIASEVAAQLVACVSSCGRTNPRLAERKLGALGWETVRALGGWELICTTLRNDEVNTFRAQARNVTKSLLQRAAQAERRALLAAPAPSLRGEQQSFGLSPKEQLTRMVKQLAEEKSNGVS